MTSRPDRAEDRTGWQSCNDGNHLVDPEGAAPSCGAHVLCVECWETGDFRCRECQQVWIEQKVADGKDWFATILALPAHPSPPYVAPVRPAPLDLTGAVGLFTTTSSLSLRECAHCRDGIHVGRPRVDRRPDAASHVTHHYHPECVILP